MEGMRPAVMALSNNNDVGQSLAHLSRRAPTRHVRRSDSVSSGQQSRGGSTALSNRAKAKALLKRSSASSGSPVTSSPSTPGGWDDRVMPESPYSNHVNTADDRDDRRCSLCYLQSNSLLGQSQLTLHLVADDFHRPSTRKHLPPRLPQSTDAVNRPRTTSELQSYLKRNDVVNEVDIVGLPDDIALDDLIEPGSKSVLAHWNCALWSEGVVESGDNVLLNVDRACSKGMAHRCSGCNQLGASVLCRMDGCNKRYHYPCAVGNGGFLDAKALVMFCPEHAEEAADFDDVDATCETCKEVGAVSDQLFCSSCGHRYHANCLQAPVECRVSVRAGWQCPTCKTCQQCRNAGDDSRMLVCDSCDKGYHMYCMQPPLTAIPKHGWKCKLCRVCSDCGTRGPAGSASANRWHSNSSICDSCHQQRNKGMCCPICSRAYRHQKQQMRSCVQCRKQVHAECDTDALGSMDGEYLCPVCRRSPLVSDAMIGGAAEAPSLSASPSAIETDDPIEEDLIKFMNSAIVGDNFSNTSSPLGGLNPNDLGDPSMFQLQDIFPASSTDSLSAASSLECRVPNAPPPRSKQGGQSISRKKPGRPTGSASVRTRSGGKTDGKAAGKLCRSNSNGRRRGRPSMPSIGSSRSLDQESIEAEDGKHKEDDNDYIRTVVVTSSKDDYVCEQPLCLVCGSIGKDVEGTMVSCTSCAQSYHSYCVNIHDKLNLSILKRGWRCLDCTVCEGCGEGNDEPHLLLCDECDVSYHIYCLDPPLDRIPQGPWRCKMCSECRRCRKPIEVGGRMDGLCLSCSSLRKCPKCAKSYELGEAVVKCQNCFRWYHGKCEELYSEEMLEAAAERSFRCSFCRPLGTQSLPSSSLISGDAMHYIADGVALTKAGLEASQWRPPAEVRQRRPPPPTVPSGAAQAISDTINEVTAAVMTNRSESTAELDDVPMDETFEGGVGGEETAAQRRAARGRKAVKLGIGGFFVRATRQRSVSNVADTQPAAVDANGTPRPSEGFFGVQAVEGRHLLDMQIDCPTLEDQRRTAAESTETKATSQLDEKSADILRDQIQVAQVAAAQQKQQQQQVVSDDVSMLAAHDDDMMADLGAIFNDHDPAFIDDIDEFNFDEIALMNDLEHGDDQSDDAVTAGGDHHMSTDISSQPVGDVTSEHSSASATHTAFSNQALESHGAYDSLQAHIPIGPMEGVSSSFFPGNGSLPIGGVGQSPHSAYPSTSVMAQPLSRSNSQMGEAPSSASEKSNNTERWEQDEPLGDRATIAAVLFANVNHADLKTQHPLWVDRVKQIQKLWRALEATKRQEYVNKARENRANDRRQQPKTKKTTAPKSQEMTVAPVDVSQSPQSNPSTPFTPSGSRPPGPFSPAIHAAMEVDRPLSGMISQSPGAHGSPGMAQMQQQMPSAYQSTASNAFFPQDAFDESQQKFKIPPVPYGMNTHGVRTPLQTTPSPHPHSQQQMLMSPQPSPSPVYQGGPSPVKPNTLGEGNCGALPTQQQMYDEQMQRQQQAAHAHGFQHPGAQPQMGHLPMHQQQNPAMWHQMQSHPGQQPTMLSHQAPPPPPPQPVDPQYDALLRRQQEINNVQQAIEAELNKLRKQKKNLAAKRRQVQKTTDSQGDLNQQDAMTLERLQASIPTKQKELEMIKKQAKQHQTTVQEYQTRNGIPPPPAGGDNQTAVRPQAPFPAHRAPFNGPGQPAQLGMPSPQQQQQQQQMMMANRPPPLRMPPPQQMMRMGAPGDQQQHLTHPQLMSPGSQVGAGYRPAGVYGAHEQAMMQQHIRPQYLPHPSQSYPLAQQGNGGMVMPTPASAQQVPAPLAMPPDDASTEIKRQQRPRKRRKKTSDQGPGSADSNVGPAALVRQMTERQPMGSFRGVSPPELSSFERDIFDVVDMIVQKVSIEIDGEDAERENGLLKRLLQSQSPAADMPGASGQRAAEPPKPKRKRANPKAKNAFYSSDEHALFLERVSTQLKLLPRIPLSALEPSPRVDRSSCQTIGVTNLPDRIDQPSISGTDLGEMKLLFMDDYYKCVFGKEPPKEHARAFPSNSSTNVDGKSLAADLAPDSPTMSMLAADADVMALKRRPDSPLSIVYDDADVQDSTADLYDLPALKLLASDDGRLSPNLKLVTHVPVRAIPPDPDRQAFFEKADASRAMACAMTMNEEAAGNIPAVMARLAALLDLAEPIKYEVHIDTPPQTPEIKSQSSNAVEAPDRKPEFCRHCDAIVKQAAICRRMSELGLTPTDDVNDGVSFCSLPCYYRFVANCKVALSAADLKAAAEHVDEQTMAKLTQLSSDSFSSTNEAADAKATTSSEKTSDDIKFDEIIESVVCRTESLSTPARPYSGTRETALHIKDLLATADLIGDDAGADSASLVAEKRWKGTRWVVWDAALRDSYHKLQEQIKQMIMALRPAQLEAPDRRKCSLCSANGDGEAEVAGRLLNMDADQWVHVNCALWSSEVYETQAGALVHVDQAVRRAQMVECVVCHQLGASIRCYNLLCPNHYHLPCAKQVGCNFMKDKTFFCPEHSQDVKIELALNRLSVLRRIYVEREENRLIAKLFQQGDAGSLILRVGSLIFHQIGQLLPHQWKSFHNSDFIFPVGYHVTRIFWSPSNLHGRIRYECSIKERDGLPEFVVSFNEERDITISDVSASAVWNNILTPLERLRDTKSTLLKLFPRHLPGENLFGLTEPSISKMIESLPGVDQLLTYAFKHGGSPLMDLPLAVNPSGCARCEPRFRTYIKHHRHLTVHASEQTSSNSNATTDRTDLRALLQLSGYSADLLGSPYYRFESGGGSLQSSQYSQYMRMKRDWRQAVYLARSKIQGLGLYARRDTEMNSMIIEYKGEVIRNEVAERREKLYQEQNRGVYMFRIDSERVIDATMAGGPARYINHSCDPNCSTQLLPTGPNGDDIKIIIIANRPINALEELTYDYQFDLEDTQDKLPCLCGAPNCRKWMN
uniref:[Histone H3]-lysine(4) N-trimethyltransferase n=1 Tax=Plectus sambesii TaxID=2011161 RepID=A0A914X0L3_9BILA